MPSTWVRTSPGRSPRTPACMCANEAAQSHRTLHCHAKANHNRMHRDAMTHTDRRRCSRLRTRSTPPMIPTCTHAQHVSRSQRERAPKVGAHTTKHITLTAGTALERGTRDEHGRERLRPRPAVLARIPPASTLLHVWRTADVLADTGSRPQMIVAM